MVINLRIDTAETRELGIEYHVCELQLTLRDFAELIVRLFHYKTQWQEMALNANDTILLPFLVTF